VVERSHVAKLAPHMEWQMTLHALGAHAGAVCQRALRLAVLPRRLTSALQATPHAPPASPHPQLASSQASLQTLEATPFCACCTSRLASCTLFLCPAGHAMVFMGAVLFIAVAAFALPRASKALRGAGWAGWGRRPVEREA
jgi:hypothetical protein